MTAPSIREAMIHALASLAAAVSLLERSPHAKKAAPSDKMFYQMIADYKTALENGRSAILSAQPQDVVEGIARIIDPHSFMDIPFTDDPSLLDMVEQSKNLALRKATAIIASGLAADVPLQNAWAAKAKLLADHAIPYREGTWYFDNDLTRDMFIDAAVSCFNAPNMRQAHDEAAIRAGCDING